MKTNAILAVAVLSAGVLVSTSGYAAADDKPVTVVGEIVRYEPGHVIVVRDSANKEVSYTLTPTVTVPAGVEVGKRVTLYTTRGDRRLLHGDARQHERDAGGQHPEDGRADAHERHG